MKNYRIDLNHDKIDRYMRLKINYIYFVNASINSDPLLKDAVCMDITDDAIYYTFEGARKSYLMVFNTRDEVLSFFNLNKASYNKDGLKNYEKCTLESYHGALTRLLKKNGAHVTYATMAQNSI